MPSLDILLPFLLAATLFAYMPGPSMLYTSAQTMARGRAAGLMAALGVHLGGYAHVIAAAAGLSVLFAAVPTLYSVLKFAGAMYLVWLGISLIRQKPDHTVPVLETFSKSGRRAFLESVTVEVLNPKTAIFFIAFLPQFTDPAALFPIWAQLTALGIIANILFSSADVACVFVAGAVLGRLKGSGAMQKIAQTTGGALLMGLGVHLALQK